MKRSLFFLLFVLFTLGIFAKEIAITVDDLPIVHQGLYSKEKQIEIFKKILLVLKKYDIKATGFVVGNKVIEPHHEELLDLFVREGHIIGNHTFSHPDLNNTEPAAYIADIQKGEKVIKKWLGAVKYFRYPMLHQGDTIQKQKIVKDYLFQAGYTLAPVTIDNNDFLFDVKIETAEQEKASPETMATIGQEYLEHMKEQTTHFEALGHEKTSGEVKHILLIHLNRISYFYLDDLLSWYKSQGWTFITLEAALKDPVFQREETYIGKKGFSCLERY